MPDKLEREAPTTNASSAASVLPATASGALKSAWNTFQRTPTFKLLYPTHGSAPQLGKLSPWSSPTLAASVPLDASVECTTSSELCQLELWPDSHLISSWARLKGRVKIVWSLTVNPGSKWLHLFLELSLASSLDCSSDQDSCPSTHSQVTPSYNLSCWENPLACRRTKSQKEWKSSEKKFLLPKTRAAVDKTVLRSKD